MQSLSFKYSKLSWKRKYYLLSNLQNGIQLLNNELILMLVRKIISENKRPFIRCASTTAKCGGHRVSIKIDWID